MLCRKGLNTDMDSSEATHVIQVTCAVFRFGNNDLIHFDRSKLEGGWVML